MRRGKKGINSKWTQQDGTKRNVQGNQIYRVTRGMNKRAIGSIERETKDQRWMSRHTYVNKERENVIWTVCTAESESPINTESDEAGNERRTFSTKFELL